MALPVFVEEEYYQLVAQYDHVAAYVYTEVEPDVEDVKAMVSLEEDLLYMEITHCYINYVRNNRDYNILDLAYTPSPFYNDEEPF